jgi:hypothetical protein
MAHRGARVGRHGGAHDLARHGQYVVLTADESPLRVRRRDIADFAARDQDGAFFGLIGDNGLGAHLAVVGHREVQARRGPSGSRITRRDVRLGGRGHARGDQRGDGDQEAHHLLRPRKSGATLGAKRRASMRKSWMPDEDSNLD